MQRRWLVASFVVLLFLITLGAGSYPTAAEVAQENAYPIITDVADGIQLSAGSGATDLGYVYTKLSRDSFLRSDGSARRYIGNTIRNNGPNPMRSHTWCFYWGDESRYSRIFAEDAQGPLSFEADMRYSDAYNLWGMCIESFFRYPVQGGQEYWYAVSLMIAEHHTVANDELRARWSVRSGTRVGEHIEQVRWPHNHEGVEADPPPDYLGPSTARWRQTSQDAPWELSIDLSVTLGDTMAVEPLSQGTRPYDGQDITWENEPYGVNSGNVIGELGCYLTSATMAMNYYANTLGIVGQVTPDEVNDWLNEPVGDQQGNPPRGYSPSGSRYNRPRYVLVNSTQLPAASRELFDTTDSVIENLGLGNAQRVEDLRENLQNGELGILRVTLFGGTHFVLATGMTEIDGTTTVNINDPYENRGHTTLLEMYNNNFSQVRWFAAGDHTVRANYVTIQANSPVSLLITDKYGRKTGYDPRTGIHYEEIPASSYTIEYAPGSVPDETEGTPSFEVLLLEQNTLTVQVIGTGDGPYSINYLAVTDDGGSDFGYYEGETSEGEVDAFTLFYDPAHGLIHRIMLPLIVR